MPEYISFAFSDEKETEDDWDLSMWRFQETEREYRITTN